MQTQDSRITFTNPASGPTRAELTVDGAWASSLAIVPFTLRVGLAQVRVDGIGGVNTDQNQRMKGYCRRIMEASTKHMAEGDAALTMLYGIPNLYHKFGYATVGPDHCLMMKPDAGTDVPEGWSVRQFEPGDFAAVRAIYDSATSNSSGAMVRTDHHWVWPNLQKLTNDSKDACRVVTDPEGKVRAYAWIANWCHTVFLVLKEAHPDSFIIGEVAADSPEAADALLAVCKKWAAEDAGPDGVDNVLLPVAPDSLVAKAAMLQNATLRMDSEASGGSMARVLDVGRLLSALQPELTAKARSARLPFTGTLEIRTDVGGAMLLVSADEVRVVESATPADAILEMPQTALARLTLGAFAPEDILARLPVEPCSQISALACALFPLRHPQAYAPDRF